MDGLDFKDILQKKPFFLITSDRTHLNTAVADKNYARDYENDKALYNVLTQEEMLRQYYPSGHKINNKLLYPDIYKQDPDTKRWYVQAITRVSLGFQQIIATKHIIHITGNDVQFELSENEKADDNIATEPNEISVNPLPADNKAHMLSVFKRGWLDLGCETAFYDAVRSYMITAEACIVGSIDTNGNAAFRSFSFIDDNKLYPHYDVSGNLSLFARKYYDYDEDGTAITEWVEVWDEKYIYRAKRSTVKGSVYAKIKDIFGLNGFTIVSRKPHGFNTIPVVYIRNEEGACWSGAQDTIEKFEEAMSYFFENNKAFAFPIMVISGDGVELKGDLNGAVKAITIDSANGSAHFMEHNDVSASYNTLLSKFYDLIYEQSFTVKPPELKSGDLPGVALKLLYSPAIERAISDSQLLQPLINGLVRMVKYAWGLHEDCQAELIQLGINAWIEPYVHQNDTELTTNLSMAVQNNIISIRTASERLTKYAKSDEYDRVVRQMKEKALLDVEATNLKATHATDESIRQQKVAVKDEQDMNTGYGGSHVNETDENGNHPDENNWGKWNESRI